MKLVLAVLMVVALVSSQKLCYPTTTKSYYSPSIRTMYPFMNAPYSVIQEPVVVKEEVVVVKEEPIAPVETVKVEEPVAPIQSRYFHNLKYKTGNDILDKLKGGNHDIYIIVFYHPEENSQHLGKVNRNLIDRLENEFLYKNDIKNVFYATVDCSNPKNGDLIDELEIDTFSLINKPALFIMEHGNGFIMSGPRALEEMKTNLNELLSNRDKGY